MNEPRTPPNAAPSPLKSALPNGSPANNDATTVTREPIMGILPNTPLIALTAQAGYTFLRTYNMNIFARVKYHLLITTGEGNIDNGISFNVGLVRKLTPNKNASFRRRDRVEYRYPILEILLQILRD